MVSRCINERFLQCTVSELEEYACVRFSDMEGSDQSNQIKACKRHGCVSLAPF